MLSFMQELNLSDILWRTSDLKEKKVGYVAIIWRPNVWKSTFINALIWKKVSITSSVPQTTRKRILAIYNDLDSQIIFFDTPWIHNSDKIFNKEINAQASSSINEASVILYFIDTTREWWEEENYIKTFLSEVKIPVIKVYTKTDLAPKISIPQKESSFKISSKDKIWFEELLTKIKSYLKFSYSLYPDDYYTSQDMFFRISEVIREKVFLYTKDELPHSIFVEVSEINDDDENLLKIVAYIYTETDSQRFILIWKWWSLVSLIWKETRADLEEIFWKKIFIALRVKTREKWRRDENFVKNLLK